jgi:hypothetical protein
MLVAGATFLMLLALRPEPRAAEVRSPSAESVRSA